MSHRFVKLSEALVSRGAVLDFWEYRKVKLVATLVHAVYGDDHVVYALDIYLSRADIIEASLYERIKLETTRGGHRVSEAWFRAETFRQLEKRLLDLPVFSAC